jgi:hypothetical protein
MSCPELSHDDEVALAEALAIGARRCALLVPSDTLILPAVTRAATRAGLREVVRLYCPYLTPDDIRGTPREAAGAAPKGLGSVFNNIAPGSVELLEAIDGTPDDVRDAVRLELDIGVLALPEVRVVASAVQLPRWFPPAVTIRAARAVRSSSAAKPAQERGAT